MDQNIQNELTTFMAYMDGGTGSLIIQAVIAVVLGLGATMKIFWHQIKTRFTKSNVQANTTDSDEV